MGSAGSDSRQCNANPPLATASIRSLSPTGIVAAVSIPLAAAGILVVHGLFPNASLSHPPFLILLCSPSFPPTLRPFQVKTTVLSNGVGGWVDEPLVKTMEKYQVADDLPKAQKHGGFTVVIRGGMGNSSAVFEALTRDEMLKANFAYVLDPSYYTLYTPFRAVHTPMYTRYACIYTIYTPYIHPNTPLNTPYTP